MVDSLLGFERNGTNVIQCAAQVLQETADQDRHWIQDQCPGGNLAKPIATQNFKVGIDQNLSHHDIPYFFFGMTPHLSAILQCWCDQKDTKLPSDRGKYGMQYPALAVANVWTHFWGCLKISDLHFRWLIGWLSFSPCQTVEGFNEIRYLLPLKKQAIVTLHCMDKQEYAGHLCDDPKAPVLGIAIGMGHSCFWIPSQFWLLSSYKLNFVHIFPAIVVIVAYYIIYPLAV